MQQAGKFSSLLQIIVFALSFFVFQPFAKASEEEKDSPWVQSISDEPHFIFRYNEESGIYSPMDKTIFNQKISNLKWINL
jgi:hypothetical protein